MADEVAAEYALSKEVAPAQESSPAEKRRDDALTRREEEVAALVARGLSNRRVASELFRSERTVENHVSNILRKLGLTSRRRPLTYLSCEAYVQDRRDA
jgi:DNA-binding NarL/FixJ family response regulator